MTTNVKTSVLSNGALTVSTGVSKSFLKGQEVVDDKTGDVLSYQGNIDRPNLKCPFMFLDDNLETRRHSAAYIAKYIG